MLRHLLSLSMGIYGTGFKNILNHTFEWCTHSTEYFFLNYFTHTCILCNLQLQVLYRSSLSSSSCHQLHLALILLMSTKWRATASASKWRIGYNSALKGLTLQVLFLTLDSSSCLHAYIISYRKQIPKLTGS
jgi:hypothetical protein